MINDQNEIISLREKEENHELENFIGEDYSKFFEKNNLAAFFLGPLYFVYRKFYLLGTILGYLEILVLFLLKNLNPLFLMFLKLLSCLFYYCFTNEIYLFLMSKKMQKKGNNKSKNTSIIAALLACLLFEISIVLLFFN